MKLFVFVLLGIIWFRKALVELLSLRWIFLSRDADADADDDVGSAAAADEVRLFDAFVFLRWFS